MRGWRRLRNHLYFVQCEVTNVIKIGVTGKLDERMSALRCSSPTPLRLLLSVRGTARAERGLHLHFKNDRLHGEWFKASDRIYTLIEQLRCASAAEISQTLARMRTPAVKRYQGGERGRQKRRAGRLWANLEFLFREVAARNAIGEAA